MNFEEVELLCKKFGKIDKIRLKVTDDETLEAFIVFDSNVSAENANNELNGHNVNDHTLKTKLYYLQNLKDDPYDYFPVHTDPVIERKFPIPIWFVAKYKDGSENFLKATETLNKTLNGFPSGNLKRYGRNILIKAKNNVQGKLLQGFKPAQHSNIRSISPHRSFNSARGVIYSKDLHELSEEEILHKSPPNVYQVKKFRGANNAILLNFSTEYLPDYINFGDHVRMRVRRFKPTPKQCRNCFEYGHLSDNCNSNGRCCRCSETHEQSAECKREMYCYLCSGKHSPISNGCARRKFEREVLETADVERISIGSAKRQVMGANSNPNSSYANVIKNMKSSTRRINRNRIDIQNNHDSSTTDLNASSTERSASTSNVINTAPPTTEINAKNSSSGAKPKYPLKPKIASNTTDGFQLPPKQKRSRPSSPNNIRIELSNKFEALDPFGPLSTTQPLKRIAMSSSCSSMVMESEPTNNQSNESIPSSSCKSSVTNISSKVSDADMASAHQEAPKPRANLKKYSSHTIEGSRQPSIKDKPNKILRPSDATKTSPFLPKQGKTGSYPPKNK